MYQSWSYGARPYSPAWIVRTGRAVQANSRVSAPDREIFSPPSRASRPVHAHLPWRKCELYSTDSRNWFLQRCNVTFRYTFQFPELGQLLTQFVITLHRPDSVRGQFDIRPPNTHLLAILGDWVALSNLCRPTNMISHNWPLPIMRSTSRGMPNLGSARVICGGTWIADSGIWNLDMRQMVLSIFRLRELWNPLHLETVSIQTSRRASVTLRTETIVRHDKRGRLRRDFNASPDPIRLDIHAFHPYCPWRKQWRWVAWSARSRHQIERYKWHSRAPALWCSQSSVFLWISSIMLIKGCLVISCTCGSFGHGVSYCLHLIWVTIYIFSFKFFNVYILFI